jgi:hypothetical protein
MKPSLPVTIDSHSARIIAGMLSQYANILLHSDLTGDMLIDKIVSDEADQAMMLRKALLDGIANEKKRMAA